MRLTLRTLLAYLNDTLEPTQAREIGKKVNESDFAAGLVERIKDVVRKRRLLAPDLEGPDVGLGPNTVSEYLDNALKPEDVTKVERFCLESDLHLAEMASVDQIRTLALCEPVEVSQQTRERMYAFGSSAAPVEAVVAAEPQPVAANAETADEPVAATRPEVPVIGSRRQRSERATVPDFPKQSWRKYLPAAVCLLLAGVWGTLMFQDNFFSTSSSEGNSVPVADVNMAGESNAQESPIDQSNLQAAPTNGGSMKLDSNATGDGNAEVTEYPVANNDNAAVVTDGIDPAPPADIDDTNAIETVVSSDAAEPNMTAADPATTDPSAADPTVAANPDATKPETPDTTPIEATETEVAGQTCALPCLALTQRPPMHLSYHTLKRPAFYWHTTAKNRTGSAANEVQQFSRGNSSPYRNLFAVGLNQSARLFELTYLAALKPN